MVVRSSWLKPRLLSSLVKLFSKIGIPCETLWNDEITRPTKQPSAIENVPSGISSDGINEIPRNTLPSPPPCTRSFLTSESESHFLEESERSSARTSARDIGERKVCSGTRRAHNSKTSFSLRKNAAKSSDANEERYIARGRPSGYCAIAVLSRR